MTGRTSFVAEVLREDNSVEHAADLTTHGNAYTIGSRVGQDGLRSWRHPPVDSAEVDVVQVRWVVRVDCKTCRQRMCKN